MNSLLYILKMNSRVRWTKKCTCSPPLCRGSIEIYNAKGLGLGLNAVTCPNKVWECNPHSLSFKTCTCQVSDVDCSCCLVRQGLLNKYYYQVTGIVTSRQQIWCSQNMLAGKNRIRKWSCSCHWYEWSPSCLWERLTIDEFADFLSKWKIIIIYTTSVA